MWSWIPTVCVLLSVLSNSARAEAPAKPEETVSPEQLSRWAAELGGDDAQERDLSEAALLKAGSAARPVLEKAAQGENLEARNRAARVLEKLSVAPHFEKLDAALGAEAWFSAKLHFSVTMGGFSHSYAGSYQSSGDGKTFAMNVDLYCSDLKTYPLKYLCDGKTVFNERTLDSSHAYANKFTLGTYEKVCPLMVNYLPSPLFVLRWMRPRFDFRKAIAGEKDGHKVITLEGKILPDALNACSVDAASAAGPWGAQQAGRLLEGLDTARITLSGESHLPVALELATTGGKSLCRIQFEDSKVGEAPDAKIFRYTPPSGIDITDIDEQFAEQQKAADP